MNLGMIFVRFATDHYNCYGMQEYLKHPSAVWRYIEMAVPNTTGHTCTCRFMDYSSIAKQDKHTK